MARGGRGAAVTEASSRPPRLEVWGGVEATLNRVGEARFDQLARSGHDARLSDLDRFAELNISAIRYPILWERVEQEDGSFDWTWADERLGRLRDLGIRPIVGFLHHGHGPMHTSLQDSAFPQKFARYAAAVAQRYPWVEDYTPINEPLTTARFSGLYGIWYPHGRDPRPCLAIRLAQCRAPALAMA